MRNKVILRVLHILAVFVSILRLRNVAPSLPSLPFAKWNWAEGGGGKEDEEMLHPGVLLLVLSAHSMKKKAFHAITAKERQQ